MKTSPTILKINLSAIIANYQLLATTASNAECAAVVKADAYGLGVEQVSKALYDSGCNEFFVANLDEAIELRNILPSATIFNLGGILHENEKSYFLEYNIIPVLNDIYHLELWDNNRPCIAHIDTGMNRLGIDINNVEKIPDYSLNIQYVMSHLACASNPKNPQNTLQLQRLNDVRRFFTDIPASLSNSGGILAGKQYHLDMVRPGIALYGGNPLESTTSKLRNVAYLTSQIVQIHYIDDIKTIGYDATYKAKKGDVIATIPVGYADGYLRSLSNNSFVYISGQKAPIIGRVSMDLITVDITNIHDAHIGSAVEIIGDNITVDMLAKQAGTISYEILTNLGKRYQKNYVL